jgi:hypothetical protein
VLLNRTPDWLPALRWVVLVGSLLVAVVLAVGVHRLGRATAIVAAAAVIFGLAGSTAFAVYNTTHSHSGPGTMSGPVKAGGFDGFGGSGGRGPGGSRGDNAELQALVTGLDNRWAAASIGSMEVSDLELKTGASLMAIGGFTGGDPSPTLAQFQQYVADGQVRYFIGSDRGGPGGPGGNRTGAASDITTWVEQNFTKRDVGGTTVYDLSQPH